MIQVILSGAKELRAHLRDLHDYSRKHTDNPLGQLRAEHEDMHKNYLLNHTHDRF